MNSNSVNTKISPPGAALLLGRAIGTRFRGVKGVDRLLRWLHHPDRRQHAWMETVAEACSGGPKFHLSTRWFTEWTLWFYGSHDIAIHRWILNQARPEWIAFDIGMNFGFFSCVLAQRCAAVHGFEPVPWLAQRAQANARLNHFTNLSINQIALSDHAGKARLNLPSESDSNWGTSSLVHSSGDHGAALEVETDTLDNYVARLGLERVDFMKIDVEGAEHLILKGAATTLARHRPAIIFERNPESFPQAADIFKSLGYVFLDLQNNPLPGAMDRWPQDILAAPKEKKLTAD
jgi:FkbM family methyltransferase